MKFDNVNYEEQETVINIDYYLGQFKVYTSKKSIYERLSKKIGNPTKEFINNKKISGAEWIVSFKDKKIITSILSRPTLIGNIK